MHVKVYGPNMLEFCENAIQLLCVVFSMYSRLSLSRIPRDFVMKYFDISVPRHTRFAELRKKYLALPHLTNILVTGLSNLDKN